jgi:hypothetical protein
MRSRARKVNVALAVCALIAGFGATFGLITVFRPGDHASATQDGPKGVARPHASKAPRKTADGQPSPSALDKLWLNYSDQSTCADWAGGDGVSAIKLSSSQTAWFFADTYLGPAGPTIGFSRLSGFLHNSVVMQTTTGHTTRMVTLTGGGACANPEDPGNPDGASSVVAPPGSVSGDLRYWDADGIRLGDTVVKFYNGYHAGQIPYIPVGTTMASFPVSTLSAAGLGPVFGGVLHPHLTTLPVYTPPGGGTPIMWGSALLSVGSTVYIYGWQSPDPSSPVRELYLARVTAGLLNDFGAWQFYGGDEWVDSQSSALPIEPTNQGLNVPSGFSVVRIAGRYWLIQAVGDPAVQGARHRAQPGQRLPAHVRGAGRARLVHRPDAGDQLQRQLRGGHGRLHVDVALHQRDEPAPVHHRAQVRVQGQRPARSGGRYRRGPALSEDHSAGSEGLVLRLVVPGRLPAGTGHVRAHRAGERRDGPAELEGRRARPALPDPGEELLRELRPDTHDRSLADLDHRAGQRPDVPLRGRAGEHLPERRVGLVHHRAELLTPIVPPGRAGFPGLPV